MQKQRKMILDHTIFIESLSKVEELQFLLKSYRQQSEPYLVGSLIETETPTRWKK